MQRIRVQHPGYDTPNTLFTFPAGEGTHRDHVHYATIWMACSIFINNRQDHWLSSSSTGVPRLSADAHGLIHAGDYFLHVPDSDTDTSKLFPIVPNFRSWRYPHSSLPPLWAEASQNDEDRTRHTGFSTQSITVECCRITNRTLEVNTAHVIPVSEKQWFINNEMQEYGELFGRSGEIIADSFPNRLRLRCDAHRLWDKLNFSIVPRNDNTADNRAAWFIQALTTNAELHQYWHGQKLESLAGRPPQYLLARFAWDIFPRLHSFLQAGLERQLSTWTPDGKAETRLYSGLECRTFTAGQGQNRSASATKRTRTQDDNYLNELEAQYQESSQTYDIDSLASDHLPSSEGADSAVADIHKSHQRRKPDGKTDAERAWHRYLCGHDLEDMPRGRKRHRV